MRFLIEMTGPVVDPKAAYGAAYGDVAAGMSVPRLDLATVWRLIRAGRPCGEWVRGAKPDQLREFQQRFNQALEEDRHIALYSPQPDAVAALNRLKGHGECILITTGSNRAARQTVLDRNDLSIHFTVMRGLPDDTSARARVLKELAEGDERTLLVAASEDVVHAGQMAGLVTCGVSNGTCVSARLARRGASPIFDNLSGLADEIESGAERLIQAGLLPPRHTAVRNPFVAAERALASRGPGGIRRDRRF